MHRVAVDADECSTRREVVDQPFVVCLSSEVQVDIPDRDVILRTDLDDFDTGITDVPNDIFPVRVQASRLLSTRMDRHPLAAI